MRGRHNPQSTMLTFVSLDERTPPDHPHRITKRAETLLRAIRTARSPSSDWGFPRRLSSSEVR